MNKKLKTVRQLFNQYGNDQELDFLTLVYDRDTERMMAEYNINDYSDDLAEGFTQAMEKTLATLTKRHYQRLKNMRKRRLINCYEAM